MTFNVRITIPADVILQANPSVVAGAEKFKKELEDEHPRHNEVTVTVDYQINS